MKGRTAGVIGAISALAAGSGMGAAATHAEAAVPVANSYADLLQPIPNAVERLQVADAERAEQPAVLIKAQYAVHDHHHHHHVRRHVRAGYTWLNGHWVRNHHHHHHHHN